MNQDRITGYVYRILNLVNGKVYIGCTCTSLKHRFEQHVSAARKGSLLAIHCAFRKYGLDSFTIELVEVVHGSYSDLLLAEIKQISCHNCISPSGYNLTAGGEGVDYSVSETRDRLMVGVRRRSLNSEWLHNTTVANRRKATDPNWLSATREASRKKKADPEWQQAILGGVRKRQSDPKWLESTRKAAEIRGSDPEWLANNAQMIKQLHADPARKQAWGESHAVSMQKKVAARDALDSPEEVARRARIRERTRRIRAERRKTLNT